MRKIFFSIFLISLGIGLSLPAQANGLSLVITKECEIQHSGDNCIAKFDITNSTGETLDGTAFFDVGYNGVCGSFFKDGGIDVWYDNHLPKMEWNGVRFVFTGFEIPNGLSKTNLEIHTSLALCPGEYIFGLQLNGVGEDEEEYPTMPVIIGGGGGHGGTAAFCGDGKVDTFKYEECDDGNKVDGDGCSSKCFIEILEGETAGESTETEEETKKSEGDGATVEASAPGGETAGVETKSEEEIGGDEVQKELGAGEKSQEDGEESKNFFQQLVAGIGFLFSWQKLKIFWIVLIIAFIILTSLLIKKRRKIKRLQSDLEDTKEFKIKKSN